MNTMYQPDHRSGIPPIFVIDAEDLPSRKRPAAESPSEEKIVVIYSTPSVSQAFRHFRGSFTMLAQTLCRSILQYFVRINRGHIVRQRNI